METVYKLVCVCVRAFRVCVCVSETKKMHKQKEIEGSPLR